MSSSKIRAIWIAIGALFVLGIVLTVVALGGGASGGSGKRPGYYVPALGTLGTGANAPAANASVVSKTPRPATSTAPRAAGPPPLAQRVKKPQPAPLAPTTATTTKKTETTRAAPNPAGAGIPQNNGGDSDPDNNGGPSDGDGAI